MKSFTRLENEEVDENLEETMTEKLWRWCFVRVVGKAGKKFFYQTDYTMIVSGGGNSLLERQTIGRVTRWEIDLKPSGIMQRIWLRDMFQIEIVTQKWSNEDAWVKWSRILLDWGVDGAK